MGAFYTNYVLQFSDKVAVARVLVGRAAVVIGPVKDCIVVFDKESDLQDPSTITKLAARLSKKLLCPVVAMTNHDDDVLCYQLVLNGKLVDEYNSSPGYFDDDVESDEPMGGDPKTLCAAFGVKNVTQVQDVLRKAADDDDSFVFESERHEKLATLLNWPMFAVGFGYKEIIDGDFPAGHAPVDFMVVQ